jgi:hypothetical protein
LLDRTLLPTIHAGFRCVLTIRKVRNNLTTQDDDLKGEQEEVQEEQEKPVELDEEEPVGDETEEQVDDGEATQATQVKEDAGKPAASSTTVKAAPQQEDPLDFERSTTTIVVKLYAQLGEPHPDGRRVSISVHNAASRPVTDWHREAELSEKSTLDKLQGAIAKTVHRFRSKELSRLKLAAYEQEQKRKANRSSTRLPSTNNATQTTVHTAAMSNDTGDTDAQSLRETKTEGDMVAEQPVAPLPSTQQGTQPTRPATVQKASGKGSQQKDLVQTSLF